jgi:hypothetical protein
VSRPTQDTAKSPDRNVYGIFTLFDVTFQSASTSYLVLIAQSYYPNAAKTALVWASPRSIATTKGITICSLFLRVLRCFSSPGLPPFGCHAFNVAGCPIRISKDHRLFAPPLSFSQLITSFFASESLGIHRMPLLTFFFFDLLD